jgi:hypothetical protein
MRSITRRWGWFGSGKGGIALCATALSGTVLCASGALAHDEDEDAPRCRNVRAEIDLSRGTISGNLQLNGTVAFSNDGPGTPPPSAPATSSVFSGPLVITTARGTLTLRETGMFSSRTGNPDGAVLVSWGDSPDGSGAFEGVTGDLFFTGRNVAGAFLVQVRGALCRPAQ